MTNKEAIKALKYLVGHAKKEGLNHVDCVSVEALDLAINAIEERPQGEWIEENSETGAIGIKYTWVRCNQCGWNNSLVIPKNFCPNCGADMRKAVRRNDN